MDSSTLIQLSVIPASLFVLGLIWVNKRVEPDKVPHEFLSYLYKITLLIGLLIIFALLFTETPFNQYNLYITGLVLPVLVGVMALFILHLGLAKGLSRRTIAITVLLTAAVYSCVALLWGDQSYLLGLVLIMALAMALIWAGVRRSTPFTGLLVLLVLVSLTIFNDPIYSMLYQRNGTKLCGPTIVILGILFGFFPILTILLSAILIHRSSTTIHSTLQPGAESLSGKRLRSWIIQGRQSLVSIALIGAFAYTAFWASLWDHTNDGMNGIFLAELGAVIGIASGMILAIMSSGWRKLSGFLFMLFVPIILFQAFNYGWQAPYLEMTRQRAVLISTTLEQYRLHSPNGVYPQMLNQLIPQDLLVLPQPLIFRGETWCYQGGPDFYRLGTVYRESFSSPIFIKIYATSGNQPTTAWSCDSMLNEVKMIYDPILVNPQSSQLNQEQVVSRNLLPSQ